MDAGAPALGWTESTPHAVEGCSPAVTLAPLRTPFRPAVLIELCRIMPAVIYRESSSLLSPPVRVRARTHVARRAELRGTARRHPWVAAAICLPAGVSSSLQALPCVTTQDPSAGVGRVKVDSCSCQLLVFLADLFQVSICELTYVCIAASHILLCGLDAVILHCCFPSLSGG